MGRHSRSWHQKVDFSVLLKGLFDQSLSIGCFAEMTDNSVSLISLSLESLDNLIQLSLVSAGDDHFDSLPGQTLSHSLAQSCRGGSNNGNFSFHSINIIYSIDRFGVLQDQSIQK